MTALLRYGLILLLATGFAGLAPAPAFAEKDKAGDHAKKQAEKPDRRRQVKLTAEQRETILEILREVRPELARRIEETGDRTPEATRRVLARHAPWVRRLVQMKEKEPDRYKLWLEDLQLTRKTRDLGQQMVKATDADKPAAEKKLRDVLARQFEVRQAIRRYELKKLEDRLTQLREQLAERRQDRDKLIEQRLNQLVRQAAHRRNKAGDKNKAEQKGDDAK
ncbi:MAG: hypothetical protein R3336_05515 [Phycisphaeraceae bacterium]|nr:hypothetical protein [Phycisphaeraceae bacterium]